MIKIPEDFDYFTLCFGKAFDRNTTPQDWIAAALNMLEPGRKVTVKNFVDELLHERYSDEDLTDIWNRTGGSMRFEKGLRNILQMIQTSIN